MNKTMFFIIISVLLITGLATAQEQAPLAPALAGAAQEAAPQTESQEAYGEVVSIDIANSAVTITEYDYEKDEDVNKTYAIDKAASYENVKSLGEIKVGDWVALTLKPQKDGSSQAASVYVERYDFEEELASADNAQVPQAPTSPAPAPAGAPEQAEGATK